MAGGGPEAQEFDLSVWKELFGFEEIVLAQASKTRRTWTDDLPIGERSDIGE